MANLIVTAVLLIIIGGAVTYIVKQKKKGTVCIGCPNAGICGGKKNRNSGCGCK